MNRIQGDGGMLPKTVDTLGTNGQRRVIAGVVDNKPNSLFAARAAAEAHADAAVKALANASPNAIAQATGKAAEKANKSVAIPSKSIVLVDPETGEEIRKVISDRTVDLNG